MEKVYVESLIGENQLSRLSIENNLLHFYLVIF